MLKRNALWKFFLVSLVICLVGPVCYGTSGLSVELDQRPYVKLFTFTSPGTVGEITQEQIEWIANTYSWINSHGGSWILPVEAHTIESHWEYVAGRISGHGLGDELRAINPNIILTNYRNGAYTSQNAIYEAASVEENLPLAIAVYNAGLALAGDVSADAETILVRPIPEEQVPANRPEITDKGIYPFKASTLDDRENGFSLNKEKYMSWFRLDDEMIRVNGVEINDSGLIELSVVRGYSTTTAATHSASTPVLHPLYCGRIPMNGARETWLSGVPGGNGPQVGLRYIMNNAKEEFWIWLGDIVEEVFEEGYNGPWLDCTVSDMINHANAYGVPNLIPYDVDKGQNLQREDYREYHQQKIDYLFERFPDGEFYVNWIFPQNYFGGGQERYMFSGENGHHPITGGSIEHYTIPTLRSDNASQLQHWLEEREMQIDMVKNGYRAVSWAKAPNGEENWNNFPEEYGLFSYGTFLLTYEPNAEQYWGARGNPAADKALTPAEGPPAFVYIDLGEPSQSFGAISDAELDGYTHVYAREFTKGLVLVNPGPETQVVELEQTYYDTQMVTEVTSVELPSRAARILLK